MKLEIQLNLRLVEARSVVLDPHSALPILLEKFEHFHLLSPLALALAQDQVLVLARVLVLILVHFLMVVLVHFLTLPVRLRAH